MSKEWRTALSLQQLFREANAVAPDRNKGSDGTVGDLSHQGRPSSHNPNAAGVVTAADITHDPAHGMDTYALFDFLRTHPHRDLRYVISNRRVARRNNGWKVERYTGSNAHDKHIHIAVGEGTDSAPTPPYDDLDSWQLALWKGQEVEDMTPEQSKDLEELRHVIAPKQSYLSAITNALLIGDKATAKRLNDEFWTKHPEGVSGLPRGWSGA
jgi:hypothetical protein